MQKKLTALLATGRISNLPTVWCNCLTALLLFIHLNPLCQHLYYNEMLDSPKGVFYIVAIILTASSALLYVGGCFLGDAIDARYDKEHKPTRPIPSGLLSQTTIFRAAIFMLVLGAMLPIYFHYFQAPNHLSLKIEGAEKDYGWQQIQIVPYLLFVIVAYSIWHKKSLLLGLPLIGLCRFFLVLYGASIAAWLATTYLFGSNGNEYVETQSYLTLPILSYAAAVCIFTIAFASVARTESSDSPITWRSVLRYTMLLLPLSTIIINPGNITIPVAVAILLYALWISHAFTFINKNKGAFVSKCLAGFCLLDACFAAQFGWTWLITCLGLFGFSLLLQKIAPAT